MDISIPIIARTITVVASQMAPALPRIPVNDVVISEIMYNPSQGVSAEFIELHNRADMPASVKHWKLSDGVEITLPHAVIPAGGYLVVAGDVAGFHAAHPGFTSPVVGGWEGKLSNSGERILLLNLSGEAVDEVSYSNDGTWSERRPGPLDHGHTGWTWTAAHDGGGSSLELQQLDLSNDWGHNWKSSAAPGGSPGNPNSVAASNVAALLRNIEHHPAVPSTATPITVRVDALDEDPENLTLQVRWRLDGAPSFSAVDMNDSGHGGDDEANDGSWAATLPAQPDGSVVEYYVWADDGDGLKRTWPGPTDETGTQGANALALVDNALAAELPLAPGDDALLRVVLTAAEAAELMSLPGSPDEDSRALFNTTFIAVYPGDTDVRPLAGLRLRGNSSSGAIPPPYRLQLRNDQRWNGVERINLNSQFPHSQVIGSAAFRLFGLPAAVAYPIELRYGLADLTSAGAPNFGHYAYLQVVDSDFADDQLPHLGDANIYKGDRSEVPGSPEADLSWLGSDPAAYQSSYFKSTNAESDDWSDLIALIDALNNAPDASYFAEVNAVADLDQWARFFACDALLGNEEGSIGNGHGDDYFLAFDSLSGRASFIPHDLDTLLGEGDHVADPNSDILRAGTVAGLNRLFADSQFLALYVSSLLEYLDTLYTPGVMNALIDEQLTGVAPASNIQSMKQYVIDRRAGVFAQLGTLPNTIQHSLPVSHGIATTTQPDLIASGTANARSVFEVRINGLPADWDPSTGNWQTGAHAESWDLLVESGAMWSYLDDGSDQGTVWSSGSFDDSNWRTGAAPLGYGYPDIATSLNFGPDPSAKPITAYFRHTFQVADPSAHRSLELDIDFDDGVVVYLNGVELAREFLHPTHVESVDPAEVEVEGLLEGRTITVRLPAAALRAGENTLAAEVHQYRPSSDDLRFDAELRGLASAEPALELFPGINQLTIEFVDRDGVVVETLVEDVYYDTGTTTEISGNIGSMQVLSAEGGPYRVSSNATVLGGVVVHPGATVFFEDGARLSVRASALIARGASHRRIWFGPHPGSAVEAPSIDSSDGLFLDYVDYHGLGATPNSAAFEVEGTAVVNHSWFAGRGEDVLRVVGASTLVRFNEFAPMFGVPAVGATADKDYIEGTGTLGEYFIVENNTFGPTAGDSDVIDNLGGGYPNPITEVRNNYFQGAEDDVLETKGDAVFEGNLVVGISDPEVSSLDDANVVSSDGNNRLFAITRNIVTQSQHLFSAAGNAFGYVENNTVHAVPVDPNSTSAPLMLGGTPSPGLGAYSSGNIWSSLPSVVFGDPDDGVANAIEVHSDVVEDASSFANVDGVHNVDYVVGPPLFGDATSLDFTLGVGSSAIGAGEFGNDAGALVERGISILSQPTGAIQSSSATLRVGGPGLFAFVYRLDADPWSEPVSIQDPLQTSGESKVRAHDLELTGLSNGTHVLRVRGIDLSGRPQPNVVASEPWTVATGPSVRISEVLAKNVSAFDPGDGSTPDFVELVNSGAAPIDLQGYMLSDDPSQPGLFVFAPGAVVAPGEFLTIALDGASSFSLDRDGDSVYLFAPFGSLVDSVQFGPQVPDLSLSRSLGDLSWRLTTPTPGAPNLDALPLADPAGARISEWLANAGSFSDFIELYNPASDPMPVAGMHLTNTLGVPGMHALRPLSFLPPNGAQEFIADGDTLAGEHHLNFTLPKAYGEIGLFDEEFRVVDVVLYGPQQEDVSQGFLFDTDPSQTFYFTLPSPGVRNDDALPIAGAIVINEFMASNSGGPLDEDGDDSDWIELKNTSTAPVDLDGWFLTDNPTNLTKWQVPAITLAPEEFLVVFASNKDRSTVGGELHTNFKLSAGGEYLALVQPDGQSVAFGYAPTFPPQTTNQSYGRPNDVESPGYLLTATPSSTNGPESLPPVLYSHPAGVFGAPFSLTLTANVAVSGGLIYYTTDGTPPSAASSVYSGPIAIDGTTRIRSRVIDGSSEGPITQSVFTELEPEVLGFVSTLPLVVIDTFGSGVTTSISTYTEATATIIERNGGTATLTDVADFSGRAGVRVRGSSSQGLPKKSFKVELWDDLGEDFDADLLGLGSESDWVLYAPGRYDRAFVNNPLMYSGFEALGQEAMSTRFVELYLNDDGDGVDEEDYNGIYILIESIKIGSNRIDIADLEPTDTLEPEISGGYVLSVDRNDADEHKFKTTNGFPPSNWLNILKPKKDDLNSEQIAYVEDYFDEFENALFGPDFEDPVLGYSAYIDTPSWIDQHITRLYAKDPDAHRLSNIMHKDRGGKITASPTWDFDRTLESADGRDDDPLEIYNCCDGIDHFNWEWWGRLRESYSYRKQYQDRWYQVRGNQLSTDAIFDRIDTLHEEIVEAYPREDDRWGSLGGYGSRFGDLQGEIDHMQDWLGQRLPFLDSFMFVFDAVNLASGQPASQSSDFDGDHTANKAVDGELSGIFNRNYIASTQDELEAWWEVDLGAVQSIGTVRLWNRSDCCSDRLSDFHVFVSDTPFDSTSLAATQTQPGVGDFDHPGEAGRMTDIAVMRTGRYVRVQLAGSNQLQLAEVEVWSATNAALLSNATQSSTDGLRGAENAVDGRIDTGETGEYVASTDALAPDTDPWWEVDLGEIHDIASVRLFGRTDCCPDMLANAHVLISDTPFSGLSLASAQAQPGVTDLKHPGAMAFAELYEVQRSGRYVRVQLEGEDVLQLSEVVVLGSPQSAAVTLAPQSPQRSSNGTPSSVSRSESVSLDARSSPEWPQDQHPSHATASHRATEALEPGVPLRIQPSGQLEWTTGHSASDLAALSFWFSVQWAGVQRAEPLVEFETADATPWSIAVTPSGALELSSNGVPLTYTEPVGVGDWSHVAISADRTHLTVSLNGVATVGESLSAAINFDATRFLRTDDSSVEVADVTAFREFLDPVAIAEIATSGPELRIAATPGSGSLTGSIARAESPAGRGLEFAPGSFVEFPERRGDGLTDFTLATWVRVPAHAAASALVARRGQQFSSAWEVSVEGPLATVRIQGKTIVQAPAHPGAWTHVAAVRNGERVSLFINGVEAASGQAPALNLPRTAPLFVAGDPWRASSRVELGDFRLYRRAISAPELTRLARSN